MTRQVPFSRREFLKLSGGTTARLFLPWFDFPTGVRQTPINYMINCNEPPPLFQARTLVPADIYGVNDKGPSQIGVAPSGSWVGVYGWTGIDIGGKKQSVILNSPWGQWMPKDAVTIFGEESIDGRDPPPTWVGHVARDAEIYMSGDDGLEEVGSVLRQSSNETIAVYSRTEINGREYFMTSYSGQYVPVDAIDNVRWYDPEADGHPFLINGVEFQFGSGFSEEDDKERIVRDVLNPATVILIKNFDPARFTGNLHRYGGVHLDIGSFGFTPLSEVSKPTIFIPEGYLPHKIEEFVQQMGESGTNIPPHGLTAKLLHELTHASYLCPSWSPTAEEGIAVYSECFLAFERDYGDYSISYNGDGSKPMAYYIGMYDKANVPSIRDQDLKTNERLFRSLAAVAFYKIEQKLPGALMYLTGLNVRSGYNEVPFEKVAEALSGSSFGRKIAAEIQKHHPLFVR